MLTRSALRKWIYVWKRQTRVVKESATAESATAPWISLALPWIPWSQYWNLSCLLAGYSNHGFFVG